MHAAALAKLSRTEVRFAAWRYHAFDIEAEKLPEALAAMARLGFAGINLTVPHKVQAVGLCASLDPGALEAGAANTLLPEGSGWRGFNTDGYGLAAGIREDLGLGLSGASVVILGAGGAARGAAVECLRSGCAGLWISNRTRANLDALLADLAPLTGIIPIRALSDQVPPTGTIVINATSLGLRDADAAPVDLASIPGAAAVYEMIYNPPETRLLRQARALGLPCANGLGMLVHQGAKALEIWTGIPAPRTAPAMRAAAAKALGT